MFYISRGSLLHITCILCMQTGKSLISDCIRVDLNYTEVHDVHSSAEGYELGYTMYMQFLYSPVECKSYVSTHIL